MQQVHRTICATLWEVSVCFYDQIFLKQAPAQLHRLAGLDEDRASVFLPWDLLQPLRNNRTIMLIRLGSMGTSRLRCFVICIQHRKRFSHNEAHIGNKRLKLFWNWAKNVNFKILPILELYNLVSPERSGHQVLNFMLNSCSSTIFQLNRDRSSWVEPVLS